jgi:hypothetical protein
MRLADHMNDRSAKSLARPSKSPESGPPGEGAAIRDPACAGFPASARDSMLRDQHGVEP